MARNPYSTRDYLPSHVLRDMDNRARKQRQHRMNTFLPELMMHHQVPTGNRMVTGNLSPVGFITVPKSTEEWAYGVFEVLDGYQLNDVVVGEQYQVLIPASMVRGHTPLRAMMHNITVDMTLNKCVFVDELTGNAVKLACHTILRRHA